MLKRKNDILPGLSVLVPVWNDEKNIRACLYSIIDQDYPHVYILVSDNKSTDNTLAIIDEICGVKKNIKVFKQESNIGSHNNFSFLSEKIKTEYFMFLGSDDKLQPKFLTRMMKDLLDNKDSVAVMPRAVYDPGNGIYQPGIHHYQSNFGVTARILKYLFVVQDNGVFHAVIKKSAMKESFAAVYALRVSDVGIDHCWLLWVLGSGQVLSNHEAVVVRKYGRGSAFTPPDLSRISQVIDIMKNSNGYFQNMNITLSVLKEHRVINTSIHFMALCIIFCRMFLKRPLGVAGSIYIKQPIKKFFRHNST